MWRIPNGKNTVFFDRRWHRVALALYAASMLLVPFQLWLFPNQDMNASRYAIYPILAAGNIAILAMFVDGMWRHFAAWRSARRERL